MAARIVLSSLAGWLVVGAAVAPLIGRRMRQIRRNQTTTPKGGKPNA